MIPNDLSMTYQLKTKLGPPSTLLKAKNLKSPDLQKKKKILLINVTHYLNTNNIFIDARGFIY